MKARFRALGSEKSGRLFWANVVARCFSYGGPDHGMDKCKYSHTPQTKVEMRKRAPISDVVATQNWFSQVIETAIT